MTPPHQISVALSEEECRVLVKWLDHMRGAPAPTLDEYKIADVAVDKLIVALEQRPPP